ncbi:MAG TPA: PepSY domain-containing protein [Crenalkalicoccus sp.]|jgi:uncharacterized membrane protein YkoI|nr:PepSY domain-containing protein [Crenalkalicoccus sp.]
MTRIRILPATLAVALAFAAAGGVALAAENGQQRGERATETAAVLAARITPADAIRAAEARAGGRATEFGIENRNGALSYEVIVATATGATKLNVDPTTGAATPSTEQVRRAGSPTPVSTVGLAAAVAAAEQAAGGGRTTEADPVTVNGQPAFQVHVASAAEAKRVTVSGANGQVLQVATATAGDEDHEDEHDND